METRSLGSYKDGHYPRYLQITPSKSEPVMMHDYNVNGDVIKTYTGRRSISGTIDIVTTPDQAIEPGHLFKTPVSIIEVTEVLERRKAKGDYAVDGVEWLRCAFNIKTKL